MRNTEPQDRQKSRAVQDELKKRYIHYLKVASKREDNDFIVKDKNELDKYSFECGVLLALMTGAGFGDGHCENLIISGKRPRLIDCEVCFAFMAASLENTECLDLNAGCMNKFALIPQVHSCLFDINGKVEKTLNHLEQNRIFRLYMKKGEQLIACNPDKKYLIEGYTKGLELLSKTGMMLEWLKQPQVQGMFIRVLAAGTAELKKHMERICDNDFNPEYYNLDTQKLHDQRLSAYTHQLQEYRLRSHSGLAQLSAIPPLPFYAAFDPRHPHSNHLNEHKACSIPVFYA